MTTITWAIRPATSADHDAVIELWRETGLGRAAPDEWDVLITGSTNAVLVAEEAGRLMCPSRSDTILTLTPAPNASVAIVWRRS